MKRLKNLKDSITIKVLKKVKKNYSPRPKKY